MKIKFTANKTTNYYYWLQALSGWDNPNNDIEVSDDVLLRAIVSLRESLERAPNPRSVLSELYTSRITTSEALEIQQLVQPAEEYFDRIWALNKDILFTKQHDLQHVDFNAYDRTIQSIVQFLDAQFDTTKTYTTQLLINDKNSHAVGHALRNTNYTLVMPDVSNKETAQSNTLMTVMHEYIHHVEFSSKITRPILKNAYEKYIGNNIDSPAGHDWQSMFVEALVFSLASKRIGGLLRPLIYDKPSPSVEEMKPGFMRRVSRNDLTTYDVINWVALHIVVDIEEYLSKGKTFDQGIADKIGKTYKEFYLTLSR